MFLILLNLFELLLTQSIFLFFRSFLQELPESDDGCSDSSSSKKESNDEDSLENESDGEIDIDDEEEDTVLDESSHLRCIFPVNGAIDSILIVSAALAILVIEKNISKVAFNSLVDVLLVSVKYSN